MGAKKKYKNFYPQEKGKNPSSQQDKQMIDVYQKKISELLKDPAKQKKQLKYSLNSLIRKKSKRLNFLWAFLKSLETALLN